VGEKAANVRKFDRGIISSLVSETEPTFKPNGYPGDERLRLPEMALVPLTRILGTSYFDPNLEDDYGRVGLITF